MQINTVPFSPHRVSHFYTTGWIARPVGKLVAGDRIQTNRGPVRVDRATHTKFGWTWLTLHVPDAGKSTVVHRKSTTRLLVAGRQRVEVTELI